MKRLSVLILLVGLAAAGRASADETTFCNAKITTLPYTINVQGHYCFDRNLSTAITTGNAITINSDFVVLDLNNFKLGGGSAGLGTQARGIYANARKNITIRNGNIRGFHYGVLIEGTELTSGGHVIENNVIDGNTFAGMFLFGDGIVVRNNLVSATGGSSVATFDAPRGILVNDGFAVVAGNTVSGLMVPVTSYGDAIDVQDDVADRNVIQLPNVAGDGALYGIYSQFFNTNSVCRDNTVASADFPYTNCDFVGDNHP
jgi:parallel beta-helix repeat protein